MHSLSFLYMCWGTAGNSMECRCVCLGVHVCVLLAHLLPHVFPSIAGGIRLTPSLQLSPGLSVSLGLCPMSPFLCFLLVSRHRCIVFFWLFPFSLPLSKWTIWGVGVQVSLDTCLLFVPPTYLPPSLVPLLFIIRFIKDRMKYNS